MIAIACLKFAISHAEINQRNGHGPCVENINIEQWKFALSELEKIHAWVEKMDAATLQNVVDEWSKEVE